MSGSFEWWQTIIAGISTLAIFSFLLKENPFYRFFEHVFIGVAAAIGISQQIRTFVLPDLIKPLLGWNRPSLPDGTWLVPYDQRSLLLIIPMIFGLLYYFILSRRHVWLAQLTIGFSLGVGGGLAFKGFVNEVFPQIADSWRPLYVPGSWIESFNNCLFAAVLFSSLCYFFITFRRSPGGFVDRSSAAGRYFMMGCFGAFFGSTIMARMALLVERLQFLIEQWIPAVTQPFA
jgi:hypothetical protein